MVTAGYELNIIISLKYLKTSKAHEREGIRVKMHESLQEANMQHSNATIYDRCEGGF